MSAYLLCVAGKIVCSISTNPVILARMHSLQHFFNQYSLRYSFDSNLYSLCLGSDFKNGDTINFSKCFGRSVGTSGGPSVGRLHGPRSARSVGCGLGRSARTSIGSTQLDQHDHSNLVRLQCEVYGPLCRLQPLLKKSTGRDVSEISPISNGDFFTSNFCASLSFAPVAEKS